MSFYPLNESQQEHFRFPGGSNQPLIARETDGVPVDPHQQLNGLRSVDASPPAVVCFRVYENSHIPRGR